MNILFLGDSITDCGHCFTPDNLGAGYVKILSLRYGISAVNGGSDGFTFPDMLRKWKLMYAQRAYDGIVVTCGINDVSVIADLKETGRHEAAFAFLEDSMTALRTFLDELRVRTESRESDTATPSSTRELKHRGSVPSSDSPRILLLEPFLFPVPQTRLRWIPALQEVRQRMQETITAFNAVQRPLAETGSVHTASAPCARYVPTQAALDDLTGQIGLSAVTTDGIHLTDKGHECLAKLVTDALEIEN